MPGGWLRVAVATDTRQDEAVFEGFEELRVDVGGGVDLRVRAAGSGPPVVLLHGHPRTHTTWHRVSPLLVEAGYTVVCPDLRGYGQSAKPATTADHAPYSKRAMAGDVRALMGRLGHERFAVVGHDRGSYVAARLALDAPPAVSHLAVLDSVPIGEALARADAGFATAWWHWFFFAQPERPERAILADPEAWYGGTAARMGEENYADYQRAISDPATVRAMLEDYRAGLGVDRAADNADRAAGHRIACPTLVLWSTRDDMELLYGDVLGVWRPWIRPNVSLRGRPIDSGHHMAEDAPEVLAAELVAFLGSRSV
jgi:haloacetate dehalogenase